MDLNYYLHREQIERVRAEHADTGPAREAHRELAELYRQQIEEYRTVQFSEFRPTVVPRSFTPPAAHSRPV